MSLRDSNLKKLEYIKNIKEESEDEDTEYIKKISLNVINRVRDIILRYNYPVVIVPTFRRSIQLEYEKDDNEYFEIEIKETCSSLLRVTLPEYTVVEYWEVESEKEMKEIDRAIKEFYDE